MPRLSGAGASTLGPVKKLAEPLEKAVRLRRISKGFRPVAQLAEQRSPKPQVGGSIPSWPAIIWQGAALDVGVAFL